MGKEDKCFTKKNKTGGSYTTCVDKKGDQLREKDVKPKKKKLVLKEPAKAAPLQNVSAHMSALSASAPTAPPANYNMLRPEIRKNILQFAGNPKKVIEIRHAKLKQHRRKRLQN